jgi:hypothetical protein
MRWIFGVLGSACACKDRIGLFSSAYQLCSYFAWSDFSPACIVGYRSSPLRSVRVRSPSSSRHELD